MLPNRYYSCCLTEKKPHFESEEDYTRVPLLHFDLRKCDKVVKQWCSRSRKFHKQNITFYRLCSCDSVQDWGHWNMASRPDSAFTLVPKYTYKYVWVKLSKNPLKGDFNGHVHRLFKCETIATMIFIVMYSSLIDYGLK